MKIYFGVMRFVFILLFLGVYQAHAVTHYKWRFVDVPGWRYEAVNQAYAFAVWYDGPGHDSALLGVNTASDQNWAAVGREFKFPSIDVGKNIYWYLDILATGNYVVNMEVINPNNWTYFSLRRQSGSGDGVNLRSHLFPTFVIPSRSLYYRVSYLGRGVVENKWRSINVPLFMFVSN
jgi:hypothetical protein